MKPNIISLEIAIWEFCSDRELKPLDDLIRSKYNYLRKCIATDLFLLPDNDAQRMHKRIRSLEAEVATLYALKAMITRLRELYMNITADIGEAIHKERQDLLMERQHWKSLYEQEHAECMREKANGLFWVNEALKYLRNGRAK